MLNSERRETPETFKTFLTVGLTLLLITASKAFAVDAVNTEATTGYTNTDVVLLLVFVLLGMEIVDEMDKIEDMQALARQQWAKRARALGLDVDNSKE